VLGLDSGSRPRERECSKRGPMAKTFSFERSITFENPMTAAELDSAERVLARLIAAAYAADHPELFGANTAGDSIMGSRLQALSPKSDGHDTEETAKGTYAATE